ncbi:DnaJ domain protein [Gregarina niphandrodes]|uniref:DnaJ domain protein n=1 Tax=Gregarina niphandrodes TaxID=110365 RepID=A0A023AYQ7_GRENI|nr:DnaJ domain protein [Gregarina niphandrodes]EZG43802.1 DnaJ domain protein [Gregarina niphandrodes]|eukprot:XP_011133012.1 DnaJ domain protein [Gregarina niphandrodes]
MSRTTTKPFYAILNVLEHAPTKEITKAYRLLALKYHPDKTGGSEEMMKRINEAYGCLKDPVKRKVYDRTGSVEGAENDVGGVIDEQDILEFEQHYRGSSLEEDDVIDFVTRFEGNVTKLFDYIPLSREEELEDHKRLLKFAKKYIDRHGTERMKKNFQMSSKKLKVKKKKSSSNAGTSLEDLTAQIKANQARRAKHTMKQVSAK